MKCILCNQRKAKRFCPAKDDQICAQCCGEKRVLEIDCPETCQYLKAGREREAEDYQKRLRSLDKASRDRILRVLLEHRDVVAHLEYAISQERRRSRHLGDKDVDQALELLIENYTTEDKGILYEKKSDDLQVESLRAEMHAIVESCRNPEGDRGRGIVDPKSTRLQLRAAIDCLEFLRFMVSAYMMKGNSGSGYVDFLLRVTPKEKGRGSIIVP